MAKNITVTWTRDPAPKEAYYYICQEGGDDVGILRLEEGEEILGIDARSVMSVPTVAPPNPGSIRSVH